LAYQFTNVVIFFKLSKNEQKNVEKYM
jgi:hypothetical protein